MEQELVGDSFSINKEGGANRPSPLFAYIFDENFPYYLAIGMSAHEYWEEDVTLAVGYRKAWELKRDQRNREMWLQGAYIYNALVQASPCFNSLHPKAPEPYMQKPLPITDKQIREEETKKAQNNIREYMNRFVKKKEG